jgi:hypothetical protein
MIAVIIFGVVICVCLSYLAIKGDEATKRIEALEHKVRQLEGQK